MAFRRQDIAKTTHKGAEGEPRRLYPRFAKDRSLVPKIEVAVGYLDTMVGRRRGDLAPDAVLDLFGDPKLARCFLACLADSYRYRTPSLAEGLGADGARALAAAGLRTSADVRASAYLAANRRCSGFVAPDARGVFLEELAAGFGLPASQLDEALHLDAERNAVLVRSGGRPRAEDVRARYNVLLTLSTLRHASEVTLTLPGLAAAFVEALCAREGVDWRWVGTETVRLSGRRSALGSWAQFGVRVGRLAVGLLLLAPETPAASATVYLNGQPLAFALDGFPLAALRLPLRAAASVVDAAVVTELTGNVATARRKDAAGLGGWTIRRATEPVVVDGAIVLPELVCLRGEVSVAVVVVPDDGRREVAVAAIERIGGFRPIVALGDAGTGAPSLLVPEAAALVATLDAIAGDRPGGRTALALVAEAVASDGWVGTPRLQDLFGGEIDLGEKLRPVTGPGESSFVPGFGLCSTGVLRRLEAMAGRGPLDVGALRSAVVETVGEGAGADALTLHLLVGATAPGAEALRESA